MKPIGVVAVLALSFAVKTSAGQTNLIVNGGFEEPPDAPPGLYVTYFGGEFFPGWAVGGHSVDVHDTGHTTALTGKQSLDLSGLAPGSISQTVPTSPGQDYVLTFGYAAHSFHPYAGDASAEVRWDGLLVDLLRRPASPNSVDINWISAIYTLRATSATTILSFVSTSPNGGILLDDVSLTLAEQPGDSPTNPVLPDRVIQGAFEFENVPSGTWVDPPLVSGFEYVMTSNSLFTSILDFPPGFDEPFEVVAEGLILGLYGPGQLVDFVALLGHGVDRFTVRGITPPVDAEDPLAFPLRIEFDTQVASFRMVAIPEPASFALFILGMMPVLPRIRH